MLIINCLRPCFTRKIKMDPKDQHITKLEQQVKQLTQALQVIGRKVEFLERENNRRKMEVTQISSYLKK